MTWPPIIDLAFWFAAGGLLAVVVFNPLLTALLSLVRRRHVTPQVPAPADQWSVSLITVAHNAGKACSLKIRNGLDLEWRGPRQIIFYSDGPDEATRQAARPYRDHPSQDASVLFLESPEQEGKNAILNRAVTASTGEILVFTDADATLEPDCLLRLLRHFADPLVGGVAGKRAIIKEHGAKRSMSATQRLYVALDDGLKRLESRIGEVTSNAGSLYAIRRACHQPAPPDVTDDFFACLSVLDQGMRFVAEPTAKAYIHSPSRSGGHEIARRRRIVCRSLTALSKRRGVLNPVRHGLLSARIFMNKVLRRCMPVFLAVLYPSSVALAGSSSFHAGLAVAQTLFYGLALARIPLRSRRIPRPIWLASAAAAYICLGMIGTFLGMVDFLRGKRVSHWKPVTD